MADQAGCAVRRFQAMEFGRRVHPFFVVTLALTVVAAVAVPVTLHVLDQRDRQAAARMMTIARQLQAPTVLTPLRLNRDCNGLGLTACGWTSSTQIDRLASRSQQLLTTVAGQQADRRCDTYHLPVGGDRRECSVSVADGSHSVSVSLGPEIDCDASRVCSTIGTRYSVQAS